MLDLDKVVPPKKTVKLNGEELEVKNISPGEAFELQSLFNAFKEDGETEKKIEAIEKKLDELVPGISKHKPWHLPFEKFQALIEYISEVKKGAQVPKQ